MSWWRFSVGTALLVAACGSRTGIDLDESSESGGEDAGDEGPIDATFESAAGIDAGDAASIDAKILDVTIPTDARLPGIDATPPMGADTVGCTDASGPIAFLVADDARFFAFDPASGASLLGTLACPAAAGAGPFVMSVSRSRQAYVLYTDWNLYRVDTTTLACQSTSYVAGQLGFPGDVGISVSRGQGQEWLYVYGRDSVGPALARGDLTNFVLTRVAPIVPAIGYFPVDIQADVYERVFALGIDGDLVQINGTTGAVVGQDRVPGFTATDSWALLDYGGTLFTFGATAAGTTTVLRFDLATKAATAFGSVPAKIAGGSAAPCAL